MANTKISAVYIIILIVASVLSFYVGRITSPGSEENPLAGETITAALSSGPWTDSVKAIVKAFSDKTGIEVTVVDIPYMTFHEKLMAEFVAGGSGYDVIGMNYQWLGEMATYLVPIEDIIAEKDPGFLDQFVTKRVDAQTTWNGKVYGIPWSGNVLVLYYRTDLFDNAGLQPPTTWDEYYAYAAQFDQDGTHGHTIMGIRYQCMTEFATRLYALGGQIYDEEFNPIGQINSTSSIDTLQDMIDSISTAIPSSVSNSHAEVALAFLAGDAAMSINWMGIVEPSVNPEESEVVGKVGLAPTPGEAPQGGGYTLSIPLTSTHQDAAYEFIKYISSAEIQEFAFKNYWTFPTRPDVLEDPELATTFDYIKDYLPSILKANEGFVPRPLIPEGEEICTIIDIKVSEALVNDKSATEALDEAAAEIYAVLSNAGYYS